MFSLNDLIIDKHDYTEDVRKIIADDIEGELAAAEKEQVKLMQAEKRVSGGSRKNLSFGYVRMKVCKPVFEFWTNKLGADCWQNEGFKKDMERRWGDLVKVKSESSKIIV